MIQVPTPPIPPTPPTLPAEVIVHAGGSPLEPYMIVLVVLAAITAAVIVLWPLARALGRRLEGKGISDTALQAEIEDLRARLAELEMGHGRLADVEERLDFTERILAQKQEAARLPDHA